MKHFERWLFSETEGDRTWLLDRFVWLMVAFDCWLLMVPHGGRYGAGDFNIAHFAWLDVFQGVPSPGRYVAVMLLTGALSLMLAVTGGPRWQRALLFGLYTYGWMMSRMDSYQHHYFLSIVLLAPVFTPTEAVEATVRSWAANLLRANVALVYGFTAVTKTEGDWHSGATLARIAEGSPAGDFGQAVLGAVGLSPQSAWTVMAVGTLLLQIVLFFAYVTSPLRKNGPRWLTWLALFGMVAAWGFHIGAEFMGLAIGWFSYYMIAMATVLLGPASWSEAVRRGAGRLGRTMKDSDVAKWLSGDEETPGTLPVSLGVGGLWVLAGFHLALPGAVVAGSLLAAFVVLFAWRYEAPVGRPQVFAGGLAALLLLIAPLVQPMQYDYYRWLGGDLKRRGELAEALEAYEAAQRHAPPGKSRQKQIDELRARLGL